YVKYEEYPAGEGVPGRFWTQWQFEEAGKGCGTVTTAPRAVAESRAIEPDFHASTYCCGCARNLPIGPHGAFTWIEPDSSEAGNRVGT
ncbi:MAG TPA: hypothetical protein VK599_13435, partial [Streptosporangiaceae bacterium]|nr:hypothetical protein [Streptosporangiaceae bacterium]